MASSTNIGNERLINLEKVRYLSEENFIKCNKRTLVKKDDILFSSVGSIGSVIVYNEDYKLTFQRSVTVIGTRINSYYLRIVLLSPYCQFIFKTQSSGTAQKGFYIRQVNNLLIPLPPLAEQKRIVEKLDNVLANIEKLKSSEEKLSILQKNFPDKLKKSILQSAIQGKLTEQLATDDKVEDLLQAIKEEKERLIKEKKIKKQKPLPEITEEEIPFTIPENWKWIRLGEIVSILGDGLHGTPIYDESGEYYFINGNNLLEEKIIIKSTTKKVSQIEYEKYKKNLNKDTMLVSINGTIGNVAFYDNEKVMLGKSVCYFNLLKNVNKKYLKYIFYSVYFIKYVNKMATGSTIKNLSLKAMNLFIIPLPPLAEQKRIVEKLDKLLADIEELKIE